MALSNWPFDRAFTRARAPHVGREQTGQAKMATEIYPRMTSLIKNSKWRRDLLKGCIR